MQIREEVTDLGWIEGRMDGWSEGGGARERKDETHKRRGHRPPFIFMSIK